MRCGFGNYFDPTKWYDHWITERWNGERWVRDDPQIDELQAKVINVDFDVYDQPPGKFLTGGEAWIAARAGEVDPNLFGIFDMWGLAFIAGNVITDFACLNKVELLPWDGWGMMPTPYDSLSDETIAVLDDVARLAVSDDFDAIRERYRTDDRLRVPARHHQLHQRRADPGPPRPLSERQLRSRSSISTLCILSPTPVASATSMPSTT